MTRELTLVVVEDDPDMRKLLRLSLSLEPYCGTYLEAESAEEALELTRANQPEIIVLDHLLTGDMTGLEAAPLLKAAAPDTKIVLFTAVAELRDRAAEEPAIDAFVSKVDVGKLPDVLASFAE